MKRLLPLLLLFAIGAVAKDAPVNKIAWPDEQHPVLMFTFGKFIKVGDSFGGTGSYTVEVSAENLWDKPIPQASFDTLIFDKEHTRVGNGYITLTHMGAGEKVRFNLSFSVTGKQPATIKLVATSLPKELVAAGASELKKIRLTVYSVPAGADLKVDGEEVGQTPKQVEFTQGKHVLTFNLAGYTPGTFPVEFGPNDISGGTISYELGSQAHDTLEMRDGTTLTADVESMDATTVTIRMVGSRQTLDRNQIKRILLVQREPQ